MEVGIVVAGIAAIIITVFIGVQRSPKGWQDKSGFHYGDVPVYMNDVLQDARNNYKGENDLESLDNYLRAHFKIMHEEGSDPVLEKKIMLADQLRGILFQMKLEDHLNSNSRLRIICLSNQN